ncbi:MAG: OmpA family protein, partial [Rhodospirillaceae bacterium]|nr:OmpA family protein [Rhodospirillaceae bacterium]
PEAPAVEPTPPAATAPEVPAPAETTPAPAPEPAPAETATAQPEPAPAPAPEATPKEEVGAPQTAALPPAATATAGQVRIVFPEGATEVPADAIPELDALAEKLMKDEEARIQLLAYASGGPDAASKARRISLSRALAVRSYLIGKGVRSTRMDVRALGNTVPGDPADRVDIIPQS